MPAVKVDGSIHSLPDSIKFSFWQGLLHRLFSPMNLGRLTVVLPDGMEVQYGTGERPSAVIRVRNNDFFRKCVLFGDVGFGEAYVDGDWDTEDIAAVIEWMIVNVENHPTLMADRKKKKFVNLLSAVNKLQHLIRPNTLTGSRKNISDHYDLGNDFFKLFLDPGMMYSAAYFRTGAESLEEAQTQKCDALCYKLKLKATDRVLEIGGGWGGFAIHAARNYGCHVTTLTVSSEQYAYARQRAQDAGLSHKVDVRLQDYRKAEGQYDKIVSIEMIEAVGHQFLEAYCRQCHRLLKKNGLLGLQMILSPDNRYDSFRANVDWIQKHIFPGSLLPSLAAIHSAMNRTGDLGLFHYEDMTPFYVKTLAMWRDNFNQRRADVHALGFDNRFIRKWNYYWSYCESAFKTRNISVVQAVFTRPNNAVTLG